MFLYIFCLLWGSVYCQNVTTVYTLEGDCPSVKLQDNLDYTRFSGHWYNVASFASDNRTINDCATLEFQEDNLGYTLRETYVDPDIQLGNRTQKTYFARVDPMFDAGNKAKFVVSYESGDNVLQYPFFILTTDYDNFAVTYTCKNKGRKERKHYDGKMMDAFGTEWPGMTGAKERLLPSSETIKLNKKLFAWILTRTKENLEGDKLKRVENALSKYPELIEHRPLFVFKDFSETNCAFNIKQDIDSFSSNFW